MRVTIAGIGTDVGKTVVSAIFCEAFGAQYWKPVQAGNLDSSDTMAVQNLVRHPDFGVHHEAYRLDQPLSPDAAAAQQNSQLVGAELELPAAVTASPEVPLVVELAGGLLVPVNNDLLMIDLAERYGLGVVLVANFYLGSINHTLLSVEAIVSRGLPFAGVVFCGEPTESSRQSIVARLGDVPVLADIAYTQTVDHSFVASYAQTLRQHPRLANL